MNNWQRIDTFRLFQIGLSVASQINLANFGKQIQGAVAQPDQKEEKYLGGAPLHEHQRDFSELSADEKINYIEELLEEEIKRENLDEGLEVTEEVQEELSESIFSFLLGGLKYKHF